MHQITFPYVARTAGYDSNQSANTFIQLKYPSPLANRHALYMMPCC